MRFQRLFAAAVLIFVALPAAAATAAPARPQTGSFDGSLTGWRGYNAALSATTGKVSGGAKVTSTAAGTFSIYPTPRSVRGATAGDVYVASAWLKAAAGRSLCLRVREWASSAVAWADKCVASNGDWQQVSGLVYTVRTTGAELEVYAYGSARGSGEWFVADEVTIAKKAATPPPPPPPSPLPTPAGLRVSTATDTSVTLAWSATSDTRVTGYQVFRGGALAGTTSLPGYALAGLACGQSYAVEVRAVDALGGTSAPASLSVSTAGCAAPPPPPPTNVRYVAPTGSDSAVGTITQPWLTIGRAVDASAPGTTIYVRSGIYTEWATFTASGTAGRPITVMSYPGERATITGRFKVTGSWIAIRNFLFEGRTAANTNQGLIYVSGGDDVVIEGNELRNAAMSAIYLGDPGNGSDRARIVGNWIHDNGTTYNKDHGIYYGSGTGGYIANNVIEHNFARGIQVYPDCDNAVVANNTVVGNGRAGISVGGGDGVGTADGNLIVNNIVSSNGDGGIRVWWEAGAGTGNVARGNLAWQNAGGNFVTAAGLTYVDNREADPLFTSGSDYHLRAGSPAVDTAVAAGAPAVDLDGIARPQGAGPDLGAFERH